MKKSILLLCFAASLCLAACGGDDPTEPETTAGVSETIAVEPETSAAETKAEENSGTTGRADGDVTGIWYMNGNSDKTSITLKDDGSCEKYDKVYDSTVTGTYTVEETNYGAPTINDTVVGKDYKGTQVNFENMNLQKDCVLTAGGNALVSWDGDEIYLHEDSLGDVSVYLAANLIAREWKCTDENEDDHNESYNFEPNNAVAYLTDAADKIRTGTWTLDGDQLSITWDDGEETGATILPEGEHAKMIFAGTDRIFNNKSIWEQDETGEQEETEEETEAEKEAQYVTSDPDNCGFTKTVMTGDWEKKKGDNGRIKYNDYDYNVGIQVDPSWYVDDTAIDGALLATDGNLGFIIGRNVTSDAENVDEDNLDSYMEDYLQNDLVKEFETIYGEGGELESFQKVDESDFKNEQTVALYGGVLNNGTFRIGCSVRLYISEYSDGTQNALRSAHFWVKGDDAEYETITTGTSPFACRRNK